MQEEKRFDLPMEECKDSVSFWIDALLEISTGFFFRLFKTAAAKFEMNDSVVSNASCL